MNIYEILIVLLILSYMFFYYKQHYSKESFENQAVDYYTDAYSYEDIYDDLYSFIYDDLFYHEYYYTQLCNIMIDYMNHVYNNHLCIGIKHGGHINHLLNNNFKTTSISKSKSVVQVCKYHYKDYSYDYIHNFESNPYIFDDNTFTHISLIDNELYYLNDIQGFFYNCNKWLMLKGYLFILYYPYKSDLINGFLKKNENSSVRMNTVYTNTFREFSNNDEVSLIENIKDSKKNRKNKHSLHFYKEDYIKTLAREYDFHLMSIEPLTSYEKIMIFQKQ